MDHALDRIDAVVSTPAIRRVEVTRALLWLRLGYDDVMRAPGPSLAYGAGIAGVGVVLLVLAWDAVYLVPALIGGFLLVAPFAAIGLYALSDQLETTRRVDATRALFAWRRNAGSIGLYGLMAALSLILWERVAAIVFALSFGGVVPERSAFASDLLLSGHYLPLIAAFLGAGALFALMVFTLSVVTAPMLLDRPVDVVTAAITSLRCCLRNPLAMAVWAAMIAGLMALGFATAMIGLIVIFPVLAHASWHAYRDLVD